MRKFRRIVFLVSVVTLIAMFVVTMKKTRTMVKGMNAASEQELPLTQGITGEDSTLISHKYMGRVRSIKNVNSQIMPPVSFLYVDDAYHLVIFKINMEENKMLCKKLL